MADPEVTPNAISQLAMLTTELRMTHPVTSRRLRARFKRMAAKAESEAWRQMYLELADMLTPF